MCQISTPFLQIAAHQLNGTVGFPLTFRCWEKRHICTFAQEPQQINQCIGIFSYFSASQESQMLFNVTLTQKVRCMHHICNFCGVCDKFDVWSEVSELSILSWVLSFQVITLITCFNVSVLQVSRIVYFNTIQSAMIWGKLNPRNQNTLVFVQSQYGQIVFWWAVFYIPHCCAQTQSCGENASGPRLLWKC